MGPVVTLLVGFVASLCVVAWVRGASRKNWTTSLPGPPKESWLLGNRFGIAAKSRRNTEPEGHFREFCEQYGNTFAFHDLLGAQKIFSRDIRVLQQVTSDIHTFVSDEITVEMMKMVAGGGLVAAYGDDHRRMRRIISPAFSLGQIKQFTPMILQHASGLRRQIEAAIEHQSVLDVTPFLDAAALDVIAEAGFGHKVRALELGLQSCELASTYSSTVSSTLAGGLSVLFVASLAKLLRWPTLVRFPLTQTHRALRRQKAIIDRIAGEILESKRKELKDLSDEEVLDVGKTILSSMMKSNFLGRKETRLADDEVVGHIQTFLFAGFETTSTTLAWILWRLSRDQALQERVRRQIKDFLVQRDVRTVSELQYEDIWSPELDLIGRVVLETLRLHPPVPTMERVSTRDTVLKLSADADLVGPTLAIGKGTKVVLGLAALSCDSEYFGANPLDFNPDRFLHLPDKHRDARFGPQGTFTFSGGPKACIGMQVALTELRSFLVELLANFRFEPADGEGTVDVMQALVYRPVVRCAGEKPEISLPLHVIRL